MGTLSSYRLWDTDSVRWTWTLDRPDAQSLIPSSLGAEWRGGPWMGRKPAAQYARVHTYPAGLPPLRVPSSPETRGGGWAKQHPVSSCLSFPPRVPPSTYPYHLILASFKPVPAPRHLELFPPHHLSPPDISPLSASSLYPLTGALSRQPYQYFSDSVNSFPLLQRAPSHSSSHLIREPAS